MPSDAVDHPLALSFDQTNRVLLASFSGVFSKQTTIDLDTAARALAALHGPFAVILDFTQVTELALQLRDWPQFATNRRAIRGTRRIMVAPIKGRPALQVGYCPFVGHRSQQLAHSLAMASGTATLPGPARMAASKVCSARSRSSARAKVHRASRSGLAASLGDAVETNDGGTAQPEWM